MLWIAIPDPLGDRGVILIFLPAVIPSSGTWAERIYETGRRLRAFLFKCVPNLTGNERYRIGKETFCSFLVTECADWEVAQSGAFSMEPDTSSWSMRQDATAAHRPHMPGDSRHRPPQVVTAPQRRLPAPDPTLPVGEPGRPGCGGPHPGPGLRRGCFPPTSEKGVWRAKNKGGAFMKTTGKT